jgi:signal transduction histidine kinase
MLLTGCHSQSGLGIGPHAQIEFTNVPLAGMNNPDKLSAIEGVVSGAQPGDRIVVYAKGIGIWWVQPYANQPFTRIEADSTWHTSTHPSAEYAALLVGPDFRPPLTAEVVPTEGVLASAVTKGQPAFWQRWWFPPVCAMLAAAIIFGIHRLRIHQMARKLNLRFEERLAERTRVAQELHDTLLQGVLSASMQLHVVVDQMPEDSTALPALNRVLQLMARVIDEGRTTLRGLRSTIDNSPDLKTSFLRVPLELGQHDGIDFRVVVDGVSQPLRAVIRDDVYSIGREALVNAFRHSGASNIGVQLEYAPNQLRILVRDDGRGINPHVLESGRDGHFGLSGMRERAERIGARLKVLSRSGGGTEVDLRVPNEIAFESAPSSSASKRFMGLNLRRGKQKQAVQEKVR